MIWKGFAYAAGAAIGHSCIDGSRKWASQRFTDRELVGLVGLLDALLLTALAFASGRGDVFVLDRLENEYVAALLVTAGIKVVVGFMYQRALHVSPLSVTIPYLAFTPVLLVFTSYLIINELPSSQGLIGIVVVTLGGYFLSLDHPSSEVELKKERAHHPSKLVSVLSLVPWNKGSVTRFPDADSVIVDLGVKNTVPITVPGANATYWPHFQCEEGTVLMLGVAALLSLGNSLDKVAAHLAPSLLTFASLQRVVMAVPVVFYLLLTSPKSFYHLIHYFPILLAISIFEITAFLCYLKSLEILLVSYAVAAKRSNVLLSVLIGRVFFKEKIWKRMPFILMMVGGMTLILFAGKIPPVYPRNYMAALTAAAPVFLRPARRFSADSWKERHTHFPHVQVRRNNGPSLLTAGRTCASSQDKTVSTQSSKEDGNTGETQGTGEDDVQIKDKGQEQEEIQQREIGDALKELRGKETEVNFWSGLVEEIGLIEWPDFGKVFGTTLVVLAIIFGSSFVLLTFNFLLAELSDVVFKVQSQ